MRTWLTGAGTTISRILGGRSNAYLITANETCILVDTGPGFMKRKLMHNLKYQAKAGPLLLILTHTHFDHAGNAGLIKSAFDLDIMVHAAEAGFLESGESPLPSGTNLLTSWMVRNFGKMAAGRVKYPGVNVTYRIDGPVNLTYTGVDVAVLPTPGHTAGSVSVITDREVALVGDTLFSVFPGDCYPPFADNPADLLNSWEVLLNTGCRLFLPSHGGPVTSTLLEKCLKKRKSTV